MSELTPLHQLVRNHERHFSQLLTSRQSFAEMFVAALEQQGLSVWWDKAISAGERFDDAIRQALQNSKCVIALWSHHSTDSEWVLFLNTLVGHCAK